MVHHLLRQYRTDGGTEPVGHHHEQSLRTRTDGSIRFLIDKQGTRNVEEIERHTIDEHREDEHPHAIARIPPTEKTETEHPTEHGNEHDTLDAEPLQGKRDEQETQGLG